LNIILPGLDILFCIIGQNPRDENIAKIHVTIDLQNNNIGVYLFTPYTPTEACEKSYVKYHLIKV